MMRLAGNKQRFFSVNEGQLNYFPQRTQMVFSVNEDLLNSFPQRTQRVPTEDTEVFSVNEGLLNFRSFCL